MEIIEAVKRAREAAKARKFTQGFDLTIFLREIDASKPENCFSEVLELPGGRGREALVVVFSDSAKGLGCKVLRSKDIEELGRDRRAARKLARRTDFFVAEPRLMPIIGKNLGMVLGPRKKMPIVAKADLDKLINSLKRSVRIQLKDVPQIRCLVGNEAMSDEDVSRNIEAVLDFLKERLPRGLGNISKLQLKLTMGRTVEFEVSP
jgi:large subunit ribosomal protein L1